jgi:hypothetical protein
MTFLLAIFVGVVLLACLFLRRGNQTGVKVSEIPAVFGKMKATGKDGTFATFCFGIGDESVKGNAVNVQFSIEDGRIGLDWVLIGEVNRRDREKFLELARRLGHTLTERKAGNGCEYLRAEDGDLVRLCTASIRELYNLPETATVGLVWEGFDWP